ncbi:DNA-directed RNA polymerase subunit omega [Oribacterium sp. HCP28S3_H8]|jgi:DNA-directed RNA polymerase omega subunit|uniref:DNA-directed RNA polymerase subunit omega n=1 Tax=Oribacterium sp. HCP28S3_H8 TaxID=3438945 RepID=UPI0030541F42|nr:DNA-directed RNA polymerase subunit omega [Oribacterium sp.]
MLHPSYNDLIKSLSNNDDGSKEVESRYSVVIAAAKRARQLIDGEEPLLPNEYGKKPLSVAIDEISQNVVTIERGSEVDDDPIALPDDSETDFSAYEDDEDESAAEEAEKEEEEEAESSGEDNYESDSEA